MLEELDVRDDVKHRALMHPIRQGYHFSRCITVHFLFLME